MTKIDESIGKQLRLLRESKNFSIEALAEKVSISPEVISSHEAGSKKITASDLYLYRAALECDFMDFYK